MAKPVDLSLDRELALTLTKRSVELRMRLASLDVEYDAERWQQVFAELFEVDEDINRLRRAWA